MADAQGIDVQVLSHTASGIPLIPASEAVSLAREINDRLAAVIRTHPDRFVGLATLPMSDPEAAAAELERSVNTLGFRGSMIHGHTNGRFLDDPAFRPMLAMAATLDVPIYLHPAPPPKAVVEVYYAGFGPAVSGSFATFGFSGSA